MRRRTSSWQVADDKEHFHVDVQAGPLGINWMAGPGKIGAIVDTLAHVNDHDLRQQGLLPGMTLESFTKLNEDMQADGEKIEVAEEPFEASDQRDRHVCSHT